MSQAPITFKRESARFDNITKDELARWRTAYPKVNVDGEILRAAEWAKTHPPKRQWRRFLVGWLSRAQERAGGGANEARERGRNAAAETFGI